MQHTTCCWAIGPVGPRPPARAQGLTEAVEPQRVAKSPSQTSSGHSASLFRLTQPALTNKNPRPWSKLANLVKGQFVGDVVIQPRLAPHVHLHQLGHLARRVWHVEDMKWVCGVWGGLEGGLRWGGETRPRLQHGVCWRQWIGSALRRRVAPQVSLQRQYPASTKYTAPHCHPMCANARAAHLQAALVPSKCLSAGGPFTPKEPTCRRLLYPPNAVPVQARPVTSWKGRVLISCPAAATPITTDWPQPRCAHSSAARITCKGFKQRAAGVLPGANLGSVKRGRPGSCCRCSCY